MIDKFFSDGYTINVEYWEKRHPSMPSERKPDMGRITQGKRCLALVLMVLLSGAACAPREAAVPEEPAPIVEIIATPAPTAEPTASPTPLPKRGLFSPAKLCA